MDRNLRKDPRATPSYWKRFTPWVEDLDVEISMLELRTGEQVHLYEAGPQGAPNVIIVSPSESPFLLMSRVFKALSRHFRVTAWDHPAAVFMDTPADLPPPTLQRMSKDLLAIIEARGMQEAHVVSWCAGALTILWALAQSPPTISSATFIAPPSVLSHAPERTGFQSHFLQMILELASGRHPDEAALCRQILTMPRGGMSSRNNVEQAIYDLTDRPVRDETALRRYAKSIQNACITLPPSMARFRDRAYAEIVTQSSARVPLSLLHCRDDDIVSYKCSNDVAARNDNVRFVLYPRGGHFVIFKEPEMLGADIAGFVAAVHSGSGMYTYAVRKEPEEVASGAAP